MRRVDHFIGGIGAFSGAVAGAWALGAVPATAAVLAGLGAAAALAGGLGAASMAPSLQAFGPAICRGPATPRVALTFDDGPDPRSTLRLCDALEAAGARATFFFLADRAEASPELVRRVAAGHEVALHGARHDPWLTLLPPREGARRLSAARDRLSAIAGVPVRWFRPPFGATSPRLAEAVRRAGVVTVWCSVRPRDGVAIAPGVLRERLRRIGPGDIALLHEGARPAADVLPDVLRDLDGRGLRAVTVGELLA